MIKVNKDKKQFKTATLLSVRLDHIPASNVIKDFAVRAHGKI